MRVLLVILALFLFVGNASSKTDLEKLSNRIEALDKALVERDTTEIGNVVHQSITYGHSNGWIERRKEITDDLYNGKLIYKEIKTIAEPQISVHDKTGIARLQTRVIVVVDGKELVLKLNVLQTWIFEKNEWKLLARQSVKVD